MQSPATAPTSSIPSWAPVAAALGIVVWAVSIWWMVATLPSAAAASDPEAFAIVGEQIDELTARIDTLAAKVVTLQGERDALTERIATLEASRAVATTSTTTIDPATGEEIGTADEPQVSAFFTNGVDRYNCRDFASMAEAQEALDVNRPGDPNKIDTNNNNRACEDFTYRTASTTAAATSTPAATLP